MMQTRSKCSAANCLIEHNLRQSKTNVAACVSKADERRDTKRNIRVIGLMIRAICLTFYIAPIIANADEGNPPLAHWSSLPSEMFNRQLPKGGQLLFAESGDAANAFYFLYVTNQLHAFSPTADKPLWTKPAQCRLLPRILTLSKSHAVLANRYEIFALDIRDGSRAWTFGDYPDNLGDVRFDHENAPSFRYFASTDDRIFVVRDNGELNVIDMKTGNAIATHVLSHHPVNQPVVSGDRLIFAARTRDGERLCIVQFADDEIEHIADLNLGAAAAALTVTDNDVVIAASIAGVSAIDPIKGRVRWRWRSNQPIVATSLRVAGDGIYVATQDKIILKLRLDSGAQAWRSQPLAMHRDGAIRLEIMLNKVVAIGDGFANILDVGNGDIRSLPFTGEDMTIDAFVLTPQYMVLLQHDGSAEQDQSMWVTFHFTGGSLDSTKATYMIESLTRPATMVAMDDALLIYDGARLCGYRVSKNSKYFKKSKR